MLSAVYNSLKLHDNRLLRMHLKDENPMQAVKLLLSFFSSCSAVRYWQSNKISKSGAAHDLS